MRTNHIKNHFNTFAKSRDSWAQKAKYYHDSLRKLYGFLVPKHSVVLEIGCGTGDLLNAIAPSYGKGIDLAENMIKVARKKYPKLHFSTMDAQNLTVQEKFDYVILSDLIGNLDDVQKAFEELHKVTGDSSRVIVSYYNTLWEPIISIAERIGIAMPQPTQNWLSEGDIDNLLELSHFEIIKKGKLLLIPTSIPFLSDFLNKFIAKLPILEQLCLVQFMVARKKPMLHENEEYTVSLIIPARNEEGNIEKLIDEVPKLGKKTEFIFIEGHSKDNTLSEIKRVKELWKDKKDIILIQQRKGIGKADAVRKGFEAATGDICIIFDADLTVNPSALPKFYHALRLRKGELIQGSRLVYPMEKQAMRVLNILGNNFFSIAFTWLLNQRIKDTLCGTKALFKNDYEKIEKNRHYFGDFDPFGDYDLIFGASKLNLKIIEIPIRYKARTYGTTNISRFKHGWLLLKMTFFAAKKLKFI